MTATNICVQHKHGCLHAVADRALYAEDGTIGGFRKKIRVVDTWPGVILGRGNSAVIDWLGDILVSRLFTFDDVVDGAEALFGEIIDAAPLPDKVELILAGISARRGRPESYVLHSSAELPAGGREAIQAQRAIGKTCVVPRRGVLTKLPDLVCGPVVTPTTVLAAGYRGIDLDSDPADVIAGLRLIVEMQRQDKFGGVHYIGGAADLVTISSEGIQEMTLVEWPEDEVGVKIEPRPVDWSRGLDQQLVGLLGDIATTDQVVKAKEDALSAAFIQSGVSVGKYHDAIIALTAVQHDYSRASLQASMGVQTFDVQAQAAKELQANIKAGLVPLDQANNAMTAYIAKWKNLGEQAQVAGSKFPQLTQMTLDAADLNKQLDTLATGGLTPISTDLMDMESAV